MKDERLNRLFNVCGSAFWQKLVPAPLLQETMNMRNNDIQQGIYSRSNTLCNTLRPILRYVDVTLYDIFFKVCALNTNYQAYNINYGYTSYTAENTANLTLADIVDQFTRLSTADPKTLRIAVHYIQKGKSYIRPLLDEYKQYERLQSIETVCIKNTSHFLRIYRNFNNSGQNVINIITDQIDNDLMNAFWLMMPLILKVSPTNLPNGVENADLHKQRVEKALAFGNLLYQISTRQDTFSNSNLENDDKFITTVKTLLTEFTNLFDFTSNALKEYTQNLANARNTNLLSNLQNDLRDVNDYIRNYEQKLQDYYIRQLTLERQINAYCTTKPDDLQSFINLIKNSPMIEMLRVQANQLTLRITAPLQFFQSSDFEAYEKNRSSYYNINYKEERRLRNILHKIFITKEYTFLVQAVIMFDINTSRSITPLRYSVYQQPNRYTVFPNPHLYHYNCWSKAKAEMDKNILAGNYELVVAQAIAAVQSINVAEQQSFVNHFLDDFKNPSWQQHMQFMIPGQDKKIYTLKEIIAIEEKALEQTPDTLQALVQNNSTEALHETLRQQTEQNTGYVQVEVPDNNDTDDLAF